jgi:hypothetical protein
MSRGVALRPNTVTKQYVSTDGNSSDPLDHGDLQDIGKIHGILNSDESVMVVARQPRMLPGGSYVRPNIIYATNTRIIIADPYLHDFKNNVVDIPYDVLTSIKLEKGSFSSSAIRIGATASVNLKRLGMIHGILGGENHYEKVIDGIPKTKAKDLTQVIRTGMLQNNGE